ncbi:VRR-NUC domain-containing protein [Burkholderia sp. Ax-1724]|uniref:VRR-NUC domain-containing protein n=1 Tax=Burkholderia sp. Ax-1724 TaxID=2608336 RepID=UPI00142309F3|nr:VRR-NUC domain-containing protein [Burkholderia sp. Ax-1724]NIF54868.1 VRR-NUC domain-containing protein [Burkholderia sp. Ax-1724]
MTDYAQESGIGSTGPGAGTTNTVRLRPNSLDPKDRQFLCSAICKCNATPSIGISGQRLKQQCVSGRLRAMDSAVDHQSPYKPEVNYDMTQDPPAPIMDSAVITKAHDWLPGWIQKYWPGGLSGYTPGVGNIRRPDAVIVNDPSLPPTQDNLKNVVELKFPPDAIDLKQQAAYEEIAGDPGKVATMGPGDCGCSDDKSQEDSETSSARSFASQIGKLFSQGLNGYVHGTPGGMPPPPVPFPVP